MSGAFVLALAGPQRTFADLLEQIKNPWVVFGTLGQVIFFFRFLIQWIASERKGKSVIPIGFWYLSLAGGLIVLVYGIYRWDLVIILGQITGCFVYARNLALIFRERRLQGAA